MSSLIGQGLVPSDTAKEKRLEKIKHYRDVETKKQSNCSDCMATGNRGCLKLGKSKRLTIFMRVDHQ